MPGVTANVLVGDVKVTLSEIGVENPGNLGAAGEAELPIDIGLGEIYTTDGVTMTIRSSFADIKVEENIGTIIRKLTDQEVQVTLNIAEGELPNLVLAIPGSSLTGAIVTIGGGALQGFAMVMVGTPPGALTTRTITLTRVQPIGEVGIPYKKGEISVIPVTFACIVSDTGIFGTIEDA